MNSDTVVRAMPADEARERIDELVAMLRDAVDGGWSINFLADVTDDELHDYWIESIAEQALGRRVLIVAELERRIIGTAMLIVARQQNSPHRAEVAKMLVHSAHRRRGLGRQLLDAIESVALAQGRTLLMLDTETDSAGEHLYTACGWIRFGVVPDHALKPDGTPKPTTFFYKTLGSASKDAP